MVLLVVSIYPVSGVTVVNFKEEVTFLRNSQQINIFRLTIFLPLTGEKIKDMIDCVVVQVTQFRSRDHFDDSYVGGSEEMRSISNSVEALCWEKMTGI